MTSKIALITGGSRGLGRSMALNLSQKGIDIVFTYHSNKPEADSVIALIEKNGRKAVALQLDVGQAKTFDKFREDLSSALRNNWKTEKLNFLVNNAGIGINAPIAETSEQQFDQLFNIHLKGPFFLTQKLLPLIIDGGKIINISTGLTRFAAPGFAAYASMKGAVEVLTRYMAKELGTRKITVNTIAPGPIETDFGGGAVRDNEQYNKALAAQTALGYVGSADEIGGAVAALLSDDSRWINAQRIEVAGGIFI